MVQSAAAKPLQLCPTVRPHRWQPTRHPCPWDSPGKNTGVSCHFLLQCVKVKSDSEVAQSCPTRSDPMDSSLPGCSIHGIFQARVLKWGATAFSSLMGSQKVRHDLATEQQLRSCAKSLSHVQHFVTLGSSVHETLQARILE